MHDTQVKQEPFDTAEFRGKENAITADSMFVHDTQVKQEPFDSSEISGKDAITAETMFVHHIQVKQEPLDTSEFSSTENTIAADSILVYDMQVKKEPFDSSKFRVKDAITAELMLVNETGVKSEPMWPEISVDVADSLSQVIKHEVCSDSSKMEEISIKVVKQEVCGKSSELSVHSRDRKVKNEAILDYSFELEKKHSRDIDANASIMTHVKVSSLISIHKPPVYIRYILLVITGTLFKVS